jgi:MFS family permease
MHPGATASPTGAEGRYNASYIWTIASVSALAGLLFGYDWVAIGSAKPFYEKYFQLASEKLIGWANSCVLSSCLPGSILARGMIDRFRGKKMLALSAVLFAVSSLLTGWAYSFSIFITWRMIGGVAIGIASNHIRLNHTQRLRAQITLVQVALHTTRPVAGQLRTRKHRLLLASCCLAGSGCRRRFSQAFYVSDVHHDLRAQIERSGPKHQV